VSPEGGTRGFRGQKRTPLQLERSTPEREQSLRARLVARDEQALVELIEQTSPWLLSVAQAMLQDRDEAEEVVYHAYRILWDNVTLETGGSAGLMPYLLRVARHRCIDRLRDRRRVQRKIEKAIGESPAPRSAPPELDEAGNPGWRVHAQVHAALEGLPPDQRTAVQLADFEGLTHSEIAHRLAIPLGTVKTRLRLAFGRLRTALANLEDWVL
jgi:RNA polymerase sigma-70 factor (ECF subfamily)